MANIAISELNSETVNMDSEDLFLVSKYNENNGSYTSSKIKFKNLRTFPSIGYSRDDFYIIKYGTDQSTAIQTVTVRDSFENQSLVTYYCSPEYTLPKTCWCSFGGYITIATGQNIQLHTSISVKQNDFYDRLISWNTIRMDDIVYPNNLNYGYEYLPKGSKIRMIFNIHWIDGETPPTFSDYVSHWFFQISIPEN